MSDNGIETTLRTLLRSTNPAATQLLVVAAESPEPLLRVGAVRALALRPDPIGHRALVERYPKLPPDARSALADVIHRSPLSESLLGLISAAKPRLARRAIQLGADYRVLDVLPLAVEAALWPGDLAGAIAADVLRISLCLEEAIRAYDPAIAAQSESPPIDPAFARRAAVNALNEALRNYSPEQPTELLRSLLLLVPGDEPALWEALRDTSHPAHDPLVTALRTSNCRGALAVLARALSDPRTPDSILMVAAERSDREGLEVLLGLVGYPIGLRVREACKRVSGFAWLEAERSGVLAQLSGPAQATAMALAAASGSPPRRLAAAICQLLSGGTPEGRLAAARATDRLPSSLAIEPLQAALDSDDPEAIALAAKLLRKKDYPGATAILVGLLDHEDNRVQAAAQKALRELNFAAYREQVDSLKAEDQRRLGRLVCKADPLASASLGAELKAGAPARRLKALRLAEVMGLERELAASLDGLLADPDAGVRCEAARMLVHAPPTLERIELLYEASRDSSSAVRSAVEKTLAKLAAPMAQSGAGTP